MRSKAMKVTAAGLLTAALALCAVGWDTPLFAQMSGPPSQAPSPLAADNYDRNAQLWAMQRAGYASGWQRGQEIYYMRCWMCHNEYTIVAEPGAAPSLRNFYKQAQSADDHRAMDQRVTRQIRNGSARMPAYTVATLTDRDLSDLLVYLREKCGTFPTGGGCFDEHNPPPNPYYKAQ